MKKNKKIKIEFPHEPDDNCETFYLRCKFCGLHESRWPAQLECNKRKEIEEAKIPEEKREG